MQYLTEITLHLIGIGAVVRMVIYGDGKVYWLY